MLRLTFAAPLFPTAQIIGTLDAVYSSVVYHPVQTSPNPCVPGLLTLWRTQQFLSRTHLVLFAPGLCNAECCREQDVAKWID